MSTQASKRESLYLDDLQVGMRASSGTYVVTEEEIKTFARQYDPQAFHLEEEAAKNSIFRGLAASGWHTAAITMRLIVTGGIPFAAGTIGPGRPAPATRSGSKARSSRSCLRAQSRIKVWSGFATPP